MPLALSNAHDNEGFTVPRSFDMSAGKRKIHF